MNVTEIDIQQFIPYLPHAVAVLFLLVILAMHIRHRRREVSLRREAEAARQEASVAAARLEERNARLTDVERKNALLERNLLSASQDRAGLAAEAAAAEKARREQAVLLEKSEARLREAFGALSREALGRNSEMFISLAKAQLGEFSKGAQADLEAKRVAVDALVKPIGETLASMKTALETAEKLRSADHASFSAVQNTLAETTTRLVRALHHSAARGQWGELQLRRVVELAGMLEHCDFDEQFTVQDEGRRLRPDLVVRLVGGRTIVVDAKTPMQSYMEALEAESEDREKELRLKHARAVKTHMNELGAKSYWSQFADTPEFVVMFFPNEAVFAEALRIDPGLMEYGVVNQVIPASPATLIALLKAAAYGWQQERMTENARRMFDMGRQLYDRFVTEYKHLASLGSSLTKAVEFYNRCVGSAERMLFPALRRFGELAEKDVFPDPQHVEETPRELITVAETADVGPVEDGGKVEEASGAGEEEDN